MEKQHALFSTFAWYLNMILPCTERTVCDIRHWFFCFLFFSVSQNEPSIFTKYQAKPQLFGGDTKGEGLFSLPLPVGKPKGLSKQFEEKKRRATDQSDRYAHLLRGRESSCFLKEIKCTINNQVIQF